MKNENEEDEVISCDINTHSERLLSNKVNSNAYFQRETISSFIIFFEKV